MKAVTKTRSDNVTKIKRIDCGIFRLTASYENVRLHIIFSQENKLNANISTKVNSENVHS